MDVITPAHRNFLLTLSEKEINFILIGGYAVIYHGYPRFTMDMDIWLKPNNNNKQKLLEAFQSYGIVKKDINHVESFDFEKAQSFYVGEGINKIDFLTNIAGVSYKEAEPQKDFLEIDDKKISVIGFKHLVINKMMAGRSQDKADVDMLQKIQRRKNENE